MKKTWTRKILAGTMAVALIGGGGYLTKGQNAFADTTGTPAASTTATPSTDGEGNHSLGIINRVSAELLAFLKLDKTAFEAKAAKGETLAQIAADQSITRDALKTELTKEVNASLDQEKTEFSSNIDSIVDSKQIGQFGGPRGHGGPGGSGGGHHGGPQIDLTLTAKLLGFSTEAELRTALTPGKSIADLAAAKGVTVQNVIDLEVPLIEKSLDQSLTDGKISQAEHDQQKADSKNIATNFINDKHVGKGGYGGHGPGGGNH